MCLSVQSRAQGVMENGAIPDRVYTHHGALIVWSEFEITTLQLNYLTFETCNETVTYFRKDWMATFNSAPVTGHKPRLIDREKTATARQLTGGFLFLNHPAAKDVELN